MFSTAQFLRLGGSRKQLDRLVRETRGARLAQGVYAIVQQPSWGGLAWAGLLIAGPHAVLGGRAAGHPHGLWEAPSSIDVWSSTRPSWIRGPWRFRVGARSGHGSPPRVDHPTAVLEAASELDGRALSTCIYGALNTRRTSAPSLSARLADFPQLPRRAVIEEALRMADGAVESVLEEASLKLIRVHSLPTGCRQVTQRSLAQRCCL